MSSARRWRKSSHSPNGANCVEVAGTLDLLRDSKCPGGPVLKGDVIALVRAIRAGRVAS